MVKLHKCISEIKVNELKVTNLYVKMGISIFNCVETKDYITSCNKSEKNCKFEARQCLWFHVCTSVVVEAMTAEAKAKAKAIVSESKAKAKATASEAEAKAKDLPPRPRPRPRPVLNF